MNNHHHPLVWALILLSLFQGGVLAEIIPAYDSTVKASSSVTNMESVALESSLHTGIIGEDASVPVSLRYSFSIGPVNKSYEGAVGTARTEFLVRNLDARNSSLNASSENVMKDETEVSGTISQLMKMFAYDSGIMM